MDLERKCSNCTQAIVTLNKKMISTREIDHLQPFASPSVVKEVRCNKSVWQPIKTLSLMNLVDYHAVKCEYYEEAN